jgi:radical SAM protein with 4Fe4S-binding SPASM domain
MLFDELAGADDLRLTLAGVGDPVLSAEVFDVIHAAAERDIVSIHVETDLLGLPPERVARLARSPVDIVSVHLPALTPKTYEAVMEIDGYAAVLENIKRFVAERQAARGRVPLLVPVFTKCAANLAEMEPWYDQWLRALGCAVIAGPSDYAGQIPDCAVADMSPPKRSACARLASRVAVLCDGRIVSCEQDVLGRQAVGEVGTQSLKQVWQSSLGAMRSDHQQGEWSKHALCATCREWHRP